MEALVFYIILILLSIDFWFQSQGIGIEKRKVVTNPDDRDFHSVFRREGIIIDEETYKGVVEFVSENNIEAAEYLMMMRCKTPVANIREAVAELCHAMRGW